MPTTTMSTTTSSTSPPTTIWTTQNVILLFLIVFCIVTNFSMQHYVNLDIQQQQQQQSATTGNFRNNDVRLQPPLKQKQQQRQSNQAQEPKIVTPRKEDKVKDVLVNAVTTQQTNPKYHFITNYILEGKKILIYQRNHQSGFGSVMNTFFVFAMYFNDTHNRQIAIFDDSFAETYRKSPQLGLQGFFDLKFPVLNTPDDYTKAFTELQQLGYGHLTDPDVWVERMWNETTEVDFPILRIRQFKDPRYFSEKRKSAMKQIDTRDVSNPFLRLSNLICDNVWFNNELLGYIHDELQKFNIPDFANSYPLVDDQQSKSIGKTVAFHVRRGDKVHGKHFESKLFLEEQYVEKLLSIPAIQALSDLNEIKHCYVATDEYNVTIGLQESLMKHNVSCQLHYMVPSHRDKDNMSDRRDIDDTRSFFTELYMLTHATYFVGTFNSNVGSFVAPFRGCVWKGDKGDKKDWHHHFFESYGVDREKWFIRK
jgi:hypothetical protein